MANGTHAIVLRIRGLNSEDNDWNIPSEITFRDVLVRVIHIVVIQSHRPYFPYK